MIHVARQIEQILSSRKNTLDPLDSKVIGANKVSRSGTEYILG